MIFTASKCSGEGLVLPPAKYALLQETHVRSPSASLHDMCSALVVRVLADGVQRGFLLPPAGGGDDE